MAKGEVTAYVSELQEGLKDVYESGALMAAKLVTGAIRESIYFTFSQQPETFWSSISKKSGRLARSFKEEIVEIDNRGFVVRSASSLVYARIQEEGGIITPKARKYLSVPLEKSAVGVSPRFYPGELKFLDNPRTGKKSLVKQVGTQVKDGRTVPKYEAVYALRSLVRIRPKGYIERAQRESEPEIAEKFGDFAFEKLDGV